MLPKKEGWCSGDVPAGPAWHHPLSSGGHPWAEIAVRWSREPVVVVRANTQYSAGDGAREEIAGVGSNVEAVPLQVVFPNECRGEPKPPF